MTEQTLFSPLVLPNGVTIKNRLCKAAMEENMAEYGQLPGQRLATLYQQWARGGVGLILTGNVMVAPDALTGAGGVVLQDEKHLDLFKTWAQAATQTGTQCWMQISHPGRQVYANLGEQALSPSDVALELGSFSKMFASPRAMTEAEIEITIQRFATSAELAQRAGFTGVQIHGAHGYLISQFLSPLVNRRTDQWGGELANRARFLFAVVESVRSAVKPSFCVSVKLNSADFQKGGFSADEAKWVVTQLNDMGLDLIELSGGSYESPAMQGNPSDDSTGRREAYFIDFARDIAAVSRVPIMVTGGIVRRSVAEQALRAETSLPAVQMVGLATALAYYPDLPKRWQAGHHLDVTLPRIAWRNKTMAALGTMSVTKYQLKRASYAQASKPNVNAVWATMLDRIKVSKQARRYQRWRRETRTVASDN